MQQDSAKVADVFQVFSSPLRYSILEYLTQKDSTRLNQLYKYLGQLGVSCHSRSSILHDLGFMRRRSLVSIAERYSQSMEKSPKLYSITDVGRFYFHAFRKAFLKIDHELTQSEIYNAM